MNTYSLNTDSPTGLAGAYSWFQLRRREKSGRRPWGSRPEGPTAWVEFFPRRGQRALNTS